MKKFFLPLLFAGFLFTNCLDDTADSGAQEIAEAIVVAQFTYSDTDEPVIEEVFAFSVDTEATENPILLGEETTDNQGVIETGVASDTEEVITRIIFSYEDENQEIQSIEEDVNLELRFEEPLDTAELEFEI